MDVSRCLTARSPLEQSSDPRTLFGKQLRALRLKNQLSQEKLAEPLELGPSMHIGAFRFVCTNLAVGGAGAFASGFMSVHTGKIPLDEISQQITIYLDGFDEIVDLYRRWSAMSLEEGALAKTLGRIPEQCAKRIKEYLKLDH